MRLAQPVRTTFKAKSAHTSWEQKTALKNEMKRVRDMDRERSEALEAERQRKRAAREDKLKRKIINERASQLTQPLNPKKLRQKLKTMSKKQLRSIRKEGVAPLLSTAK